MTDEAVRVPAAHPADAEAPPGAVLVVDDEAGVRDLMTRWLRAIGYRVVPAASAEEALAVADTTPVAVALCDIRMPGRDGLWLAEQLRRRSPATALVMATGVQDVGSAVTSLRHGVIDYLMKPFGRDRLREAVERGFEWHRGTAAARRSREALHEEARLRREHLTQAMAAVPLESRAAIDTLLALLTVREPALLGHSRRVAALAVRAGRMLGLAPEGLDAVDVAGLVHDVIKLSLPDALLHGEGPLRPEDADLVREVPQHAHDLLVRIPALAPAAALVRDAFERWDGTGYPRGLAGADVALGSRILGVADAYDTMIHPRRFAPARSPEDARAELRRVAGTQFDPAVVDAVLASIDAS